MPDFFNPSLLKLKSILGPPPYRPMDEVIRPSGSQGSMMPSPQNQGRMNDTPPDISQVDIGAPDKESIGQEDEITKLVSKLYTPGHEIADKFNKVWNEMPQREKPSVLRRIVASMVAAGREGSQGAERVMDAPYNEARSDWMDKLKMLQPLLGEERASNTNERLMAQNAASQNVQNRRISETERHNREAEELNKSKAEITKDRAAVYRYKAENPDHKFQEDSNGQLMALDPRTGSMKYVLNEDGVPVKSLKNLDAAEKERLEIGSREKVARIQGANQIAAAKERGAQAVTVEKEKQKGRTEVRQNKDASGKVVSTTTTVYDANGNVTGTRTVNTTNTPVAPKEVPPNVSKVRMKAPDGREIMVPMDKVAEAEQRGAKRIK